MAEMNIWLYEQIKTIKGLCDVTQILIDLGRGDLIPTILELILIEAQQVTEENCIDMPNNEAKVDYKRWEINTK